MKVKYIYKDKNVSVGDELPYKTILLRYLRGFKPNFATSANIHDYVTNTDVKETYDMGYEYNGYFWTETDIYHFEKYNMPLNQEFVDYVLRNRGIGVKEKISKNLNLKINDDYKYIRKNEDVSKGEKIKEKDIVLSYLTSFNKPTFATTGRVKDNVENVVIETKCDNGYDDGIYYWDETDIYHFEKYNMPLNQEFIDYVLNK